MGDAIVSRGRSAPLYLAVLPSSCKTTLKRKCLSAAIFGAVSSLFFACFFILTNAGRVSYSSHALFDLMMMLALVALPAASVAFLTTPSADKHIENCSKDDALLAGAGITALTYLSSLALLFIISTIQSPPTDFASFVKSLDVGLTTAMVGAVIVLLPALPFGMFGGWLYRRLARRTLNAN